MDETHVVTCFLRNAGRVLLLHRSAEVGSYPGLWGGVAGYAEGEPEAAARREIREETGLDPETDVTLVRRGASFPVTDADLGVRWVVHPFLFEADRRDVDTDWETSEAAWVHPPAILRRETVPSLWESYERVRPTVDTIAADTTHGADSLSRCALAVLRDEAALAGAEAERGVDGWAPLLDVARSLRAARPSMPVLATRVDRAVAEASESGTPAALERAATAGIDRALEAADDVVATAAPLVAGARVATLSRSGTVRRTLAAADPDAVLVAESRPGGEGVAVAAALADADVDVTLTTDAALAAELADWDADALLVGADGILPDGSVVNKVGTRGGAIAAAWAGVEVVVATSADKVHPAGSTRDDIDREPRDPAELYDGSAPVAVANPTFDVTPGTVVDSLATEDGVLDAEAIRSLAEEHREWARWVDRD
jgi:translation initiation factor 2B subunit (eIF-2B alpha/beta/delta family)